MNELRAEKERIEEELQNYSSYLKSVNVGMEDPLVDANGFPRGDIDVYRVREARSSIRRLANDHKAIMKKIDQQLLELHNQKKSPGSIQSEAPQYPPPFAFVNTIEQDSPASQAGLLVNDRIISFGHVNQKNNQQLKAVGELVAQSEGKPIQLIVERRTNGIISYEKILVTPKKWIGRGLLGCHLLPL